MDQEVKKNVTCGSHLKIKQKKKTKTSLPREREKQRDFFYFLFSHFSLRYTEIGPSEFIGVRSKVLYSMRATRGNQKQGISPIF